MKNGLNRQDINNIIQGWLEEDGPKQASFIFQAIGLSEEHATIFAGSLGEKYGSIDAVQVDQLPDTRHAYQSHIAY